MAADVSSLHRVLSGYKDELTVGNESGGPKSTALITRDLLGFGGGGSAFTDTKNDQSQELDLDLHVPNGWEKRLDLKSGRVYLQRCNSTYSSSSSDGTKHQTNPTVAKLQDLNIPTSPLPCKPLLNLFDESNLELKLVPSSSNYQSVCTLDKFASPVAAGCPGCLSYVLIMKHNPKCPRCNTLVPIMPAAKKPRIDLNISI
ncbi:hypothetical protein GOBAR_DD17450 [Gossypium barbadense]|nr:hypothetical protein GOBAR_DD17450 [Gossypium barbadense]